MEGPSENLNALTEAVIGAAIEVHRHLGPGFLEAVYEEALVREFHRARIPCERQVMVPVWYKGDMVGEARLDLLVDKKLILELKAVESMAAVHHAQMISYLRATTLTLGLLINFNVSNLLQGVRRIANKHPS
ncbi:MAG: GxxExxY protein [Planctomycetes bacterium]|nr:GxxExxY protein [Planctomycetota bacterium]